MSPYRSAIRTTRVPTRKSASSATTGSPARSSGWLPRKKHSTAFKGIFSSDAGPIRTMTKEPSRKTLSFLAMNATAPDVPPRVPSTAAQRSTINEIPPAKRRAIPQRTSDAATRNTARPASRPASRRFDVSQFCFCVSGYVIRKIV